MRSLSKKVKLDYVSMMHLIFETGKNEIVNLINCLNSSSVVYDIEAAEVNCVGLIYEICRYELYKSNSREKVDIVLKKVYEQFEFSVPTEKKERYLLILNELVYKMSEIFNQDSLLAPPENFIYRLLLEQLNIKESSIKSVYVQNLVYLAKRWISLGESIKNSYDLAETIQNNDINNTIDYRF